MSPQGTSVPVRRARVIRRAAGKGEVVTAMSPSPVLADRGVKFRCAGGDVAFHLCPVPRVFGPEEWDALEAGLAQRVRALDRFARTSSRSRRSRYPCTRR
jgi:hypothetical protein